MAPAGRVARGFGFLRGRLLANHGRVLLSQSLLRLSTILFCSAIFWAGLFLLFFEGFRFLQEYIKVTSEIYEYIFGIFFLSLLIMLLVSTGIILYAALFRSREASFLLSTPAPEDRVFAHKFIEAMGFSSWGFLLLGSPMMVAYGITSGAPWPFYPVALAYHLAFVAIPGGIGAVLAILLANLMPRQRRTVLIGTGTLLLGGLVYTGMQVWTTPGSTLSNEWMNALLGRLEFSTNRLLPSRWIAAGLLRSARGEWADGLFYLMVTVSHAMLAYLAAAVVARDLYRVGYSRVLGGRSARRHFGWYGADAAFHRLFGFIPEPIRLLILKDLRTFRRDPTQWSQFLIFFGLLAFYFVNIRRLGYDVQSPYFRNLLSFLNLAVTALILSTFTSRFIFPMLSLEGRNLWLLGLFPVPRRSIIWGKFAFAAGISLVATEALILLSGLMLKVGGLMLGLHAAIVAVLCFGLSAISVGLGARLPNLREEDPSKIAAGFGGTLNLLVSLAFIALVIAPPAVLSHLYFAGRGSGIYEVIGRQSEAVLHTRLLIAGGISLVVGAIATVVPMRIGIRAFERMEF
jgi:ABC-2 type transport system permease protein